MATRKKKSVAANGESHRGIKVQKIGATWWGQRWIEALEHLSRDYLNHLGRGRAYAKSGRVHDLHIAPGNVTAQVTGSDAESYSVKLRVAMLSPNAWHKVIEIMSKQAVFSAELLAGRMPIEIDEAFRSGGMSLFLAKQRELETDCSCADWANPCKHVAAVHYVLGEAFDKDPFLLFELRGRTKQQVLGALRASRSGQSSEDLLEKLTAGVADQQAQSVANAGYAVVDEGPADYEKLRAPLPALQFKIAAPASPGALLKQLGVPASWAEDEIPFAALRELHLAASRLARQLALQTGALQAPNPSRTVREPKKGLPSDPPKVN